MTNSTKARIEADAARADLLSIGQELQRRLAPATILSESVEAVRERAEDAADAARQMLADGAEVVRERAGEATVAARRVAREQPGIVVGVAALAAGLVAWKPLRKLAARRRTKTDTIFDS